MFTLVTHMIYVVVIYYAYEGIKTYHAQLALGVDKNKAAMSGLIWPKYLLK